MIYYGNSFAVYVRSKADIYLQNLDYFKTSEDHFDETAQDMSKLYMYIHEISEPPPQKKKKVFFGGGMFFWIKIINFYPFRPKKVWERILS